MTAAVGPVPDPATGTPPAARETNAIPTAGSRVPDRPAFVHRLRGSVGGRSQCAHRPAMRTIPRHTVGRDHRDEHQAVPTSHRGTATLGRRF